MIDAVDVCWLQKRVMSSRRLNFQNTTKQSVSGQGLGCTLTRYRMEECLKTIYRVQSSWENMVKKGQNKCKAKQQIMNGLFLSLTCAESIRWLSLEAERTHRWSHYTITWQRQVGVGREAVWVVTMSFSLLGLFRRGLAKIQYCTRL